MSAGCQHIREMMDSYLTGGLSVENHQLVSSHLAACPICESEIRSRQRLRELLAQSFRVEVDAERVKRRITQMVDREQGMWGRFRLRTSGASSSALPASTGRAARHAGRWWGVAAALIVGVAATYWLSQPVDAAAYDDAVANHVVCTREFPPSTTYDSARAAQNLVPPFERMAEAIGLTHGAYDVIDAHMCPYNGRNYAHVVFRGNDETLSLFIEPAGRGSLPATRVEMRLAADVHDVHATTRQGYHVSAVATPEHRLYLVSEHPADTPDDIAGEILLSGVRFVRTLEP